MSLTILQNLTAIGLNQTTYISVSGGVLPYTYSIVSGGAGGTIDGLGKYTAPSTSGIDTIKVTDSTPITPLTSTTTIKVLGPLELVCDIIEKELGLPSGRTYIWDQKIMEPKDFGLYVIIRILSEKPFSNTRRLNADGTSVTQSTNIKSTLQIDIKSRGTDARLRKEEVVMALNSIYSQQQQVANSFLIAPLVSQINTINTEDGTAIPYHFSFDCTIQYFKQKIKTIAYFDTFEPVSVLTNP